MGRHGIVAPTFALILLAVAGAPAAAADSTVARARVSDPIGGYAPVSDVDQHARMSLDVCAIDSLLALSPIDFPAVAAIYRDGRHSTEGSGARRTLAKFARGGRAQEWMLGRHERYFGAGWIDALVTAALDGTGPFAGESESVRRKAIETGVRDLILVGWALHEMDAALAKLERGDLAPATGAPHNWDEVRAYYHGVAPRCAAHATAEENDRAFRSGTRASATILAGMRRGLRAIQAADRPAAARAREQVVRGVTVTFLRSTLRSAAAMDAALSAGRMDEAREAMAEGSVTCRMIEPLVAEADSAGARAAATIFDMKLGPALGSLAMLRRALRPAWRALGITAKDVGRLHEH